MHIAFRHLALVGTLIAAPALVAAQGSARTAAPRQERAAPPQGRGERPVGVTQILNARRVLDLTPRQVVQLDSIERTVYAQRKAAMDQMRVRRDSIRAKAPAAQDRQAMRDSARASARARMEAMRPQMEQVRQRDSTAGAAALRVLTDAQRQQLRELQAERRGRMAGMREARGMRGRDGARPRGGMRPRR